jgi:hypothetical protein
LYPCRARLRANKDGALGRALEKKMSEQSELVAGYVAQILADAEAKKIPTDLIGRELINEAIKIYQAKRSIKDIAQELTFLADNLDPDEEYTFMRP